MTLAKLIRSAGRHAGVAVVLGSLLIPCGLLARAAHARPLGYHVTARWLVGGEGGWDYVATDPAARRLYVTHGRQVEVLDLDGGKKLGVIPGTMGAHGVVVAPPLGRGFVASGRDSAIVVFDAKTLAPISRIAVPARFPDALLYEPITRRVLSFDGGSDNVCAFDAATGAFVDSLPLGGTPEFAVHDSAGNVYVNLESTSELVAFDARTLKIRRRWSLAPGEEPTGLAIDRTRGLLLSACGNRTLVVSNAKTGAIVDTLTIGEGVDGVAYDSRRRVAFTSNGEGTLTVVRASGAGFTVAETDSTQRGARTLAVDEATGRVFVVTATFGAPPPPTAERPHPRRSIVPGTFVVLVLDR